MDPGIARQLVDKMYEKRKAAALELEKQIRECHVNGDQKKIILIIDQLIDMFSTHSNPLHVKNGGLIGLAGTAIALGIDVAPYMDKFIHQLLVCFSDPENRIRYFSAECLYNIAKVSKGEILVYFNQIFDALSKLSADSELSVKRGAELLDRLLKDIVAESASIYVPQYYETEKIRQLADQNAGILIPYPDDSSDQGSPKKAFSLAHFIPLLSERTYVISPFTRSFLVSWITLLDSVPELELITYLPEFLDDLFKYLSDPTEDVRVVTENLLADFLQEMRTIAAVQRRAEEKCKASKDAEAHESVRGMDERLQDITMAHPERAVFLPEDEDAAHDGESMSELEAKEAKDTGAYIPGQGVRVHHADIVEILLQQLDNQHDEIQMSTALYWLAEFLQFAQNVMVPFTPRLIPAILPNLAHHAPMIQQHALRTNQALMHVIRNLPTPLPSPKQVEIEKDKAVAQAPRPGPSPPGQANGPPPSSIPRQAILRDSTQAQVDSADVSVSQASERTIAPSRQRPPTIPSQPVGEAQPLQQQQQPAPPADQESIVFPSRSQSPTSTAPSIAVAQPGPPAGSSQGPELTPVMAQAEPDPLDYRETVNVLTIQLLSEHEETRVAALKWLIMLHQKVPKKFLTMDDGTFPALLKILSDSSDEVIKHDLQLLAQVSLGSVEHFKSFMVNLLELFSTDRSLLNHRGSLIIRQLCLNLNTERIYRALAEILEKEDDLEFASVMIQKLNLILITSPELAEFRRRLKNLETRADGQVLFTSLYRSWCHSAVAVFSLCLLAQAYEHASNLLSIFADLEITVQLLVQVDKLVQLIESPVFTYLRLQLLEPEKYPYLFKCLYGLLMLLPQSSAFVSLRNRLNAVNSAGFLHIAPKSTPAYTGRSKLGRGDDIKWQDLLAHFRSVQLRHEKFRRGEETSSMPTQTTGGEEREEKAGNGTGGAGTGRAALRRRVTGSDGLPPAGLGSNTSSPSPGAAIGAADRAGSSGGGASGGRGNTLSPLNPKRMTSRSSLLAPATQQPGPASRPKSPSLLQAQAQSQLSSRTRLARPGPGPSATGKI